MNALELTLQLMNWFLQGVLLVFGIHMARLALCTFKKKEAYPEKIAHTRFAVLAAARNEEAVIAGLIRSLQAQDYPDDRYEIFVVPNNCTDDTEGAARAAGAEILTCPYPVRKKGDALRQVIPMVLADPRHFDAICIFDADNIVDPNYLARMNDAFCAGVRVAQGYRDSKNPYDSWVAGAYSIYFKMNNLFYNRARDRAGLSSLINGTGFAAHREVFEQLGGWNTQTLTEDLEFAFQCTLAGERIACVEEARFYDEQPLVLGDSVKQRIRWSNGHYQVTALKWHPCLEMLARERQPVYWDYFLFAVTPYVQLLGILPALLQAAVSLLQNPAAFATPAFWTPLLLPLAAGYLATTLFAAFTVLYRRTWDWRILPGILGFPLFLATWAPILLYSTFKRDTAWVEIRHTCNVRPEKLMKKEFSR